MMTTTKEISSPSYNPFEAALFLRAFVECSESIQNIVLEMAEVISDVDSSDEERELAFDAMTEALFPGMTADVRKRYYEKLRSPEAAEAAEALRTEEASFSDRVRSVMKKKGITQEQLADAADIGQPAVSNILTRRSRPQRRTIARFATALDVEPGELWPNYKD